MVVILDDLYKDEFFANGGVILLKDGSRIDTLEVFDKNEDKDGFLDPKFAEKISVCKIGTRLYEFDADDTNFKYVQAGKDPIDIPNVNFTLINETDKRWDAYKQQRLERGFDDSETWSLDATIVKFIVPRLERFIECRNDGFGNMTPDEWTATLKKMVAALRLYCKGDSRTKEDDKVFDEGWDLFVKYFGQLWW